MVPRRRMAERISRARRFLPEEDECERRRFVPRRAKRRPKEKKLLSRTNAWRTYVRARIFGGLNGGDSEVKKGGRVGKGAAGRVGAETLPVEPNYSHDGYGYPGFAR